MLNLIRNRKADRGAIACGVIAALMLCACAKKPPDTSRTLVLGVAAPPESPNPYFVTTSLGRQVADLLFLRLTRQQGDLTRKPPQIVSGLAERWEIGEGGREVIFHLHPRAKWSDGQMVTPEDVVFTWRVQVDPAIGWLGSSAKRDIESVEAVGPRSIRFKFRRPVADPVADAGEGSILPSHRLRSLSTELWARADWTKLLVFSGPFMVERWDPQQPILLTANPNYMVEGAPQINKLELKVMLDGAQRAAQLFAGDLDMALDLPPDQFERARSEPRLRGEKVPGLFYAYVGWNTTRVPLGDPQVRRLLTMAIDRPRMIKELLGGAGRIAGGPVPSSLWIHDPGVKPIAYDPAQARRQLEADAFIDNDGDGVLERAGKPFRFKLDVLQGSALDEKIATIIRSDLRQIGVEVEIQPLAGAAFEERRRSGDFDAFLSSWDPGTRVDLTPLFHSSSIGPSLNYVKLFIPELDGLIERAQQAASPEALVAGWRAVERMVAEVQPYTFLFERDRLVALDRRFQNVALDLRGPLATVDAWQVEPKP